jgi:integrase
MPRVKKQARPAIQSMPKGYYLKRGIWYRRIFKPHPHTGKWGMFPESTGCREDERQAAIDYVARRDEELKKASGLNQSTDPGRVTMTELFDDLLASLENQGTRENYAYVLKKHVRPYFGGMLASEVTVAHCRAYRAFRQKQGVRDTTINRDLSKVSKAFRLALAAGKIHSMPPGGCDFKKQPEKENTRLVRLPDRFYAFFRDALHPALRCFFVVDYNIGRRKSQLLKTKWEQVSFEERCIYFPATKKYPFSVKAPFLGEMEEYLRDQKAIRDESYPDCPHIFFWYEFRSDKNGQRIDRFDQLWDQAVETLGAELKRQGLEPIDLHVHDLRRSAHYQLRKAGVDAKTRRAIIGHKTGSMDDRYTIIDDEALADAVEKVNRYQSEKAMRSEAKELANRVQSLSDAEWQKLVALRQQVLRGRGPAHTGR